MIRWHNKLYFDKGLESDKKREKIRENVDARKIVFPGTTGIFLASNDDNIAEIIPFNDMLLPAYKDKEYLCIGMCSGQAAAEKLVCKLMADIYKERGYIPASLVKEILLVC